MTNYLYIFEDGTLGQSDSPPTNLDKICIENGILNVLSYKNDNFTKINGNTIPEATIVEDEEGNIYHGVFNDS